MLLVLPLLLCLMALSAMQASGRLAKLHSMETTQGLIRVAQSASNLIDTLQRERGLTNGFLSGSAATPSADLQDARQKADAALSAFSAPVSILASSHSSLSDAARQNLERAQQLLSDRQKIDRKQASAPEVFKAYSALIADLVSLISSLSSVNEDAHLIRETSALLALQCEKEYAGRERGFVNGVVSAGAFADLGMQIKALEMMHRQSQCADQFDLLASPAFRGQAKALRANEDSQAFGALRDKVYKTLAGESIGIEPTVWFGAASKRIGGFQKIQTDLLAQMAQYVNDQLSAAQAALWMTVGLMAFVFVVFIALAIGVLHSMVKPLSHIEHLMVGMSKNLDLAPRSGFSGRDEVSRIGMALDHLVDSFARTLCDVKSNAHELATAAENLSRLSDRAAHSASEQSASSVNIAAAVEEMSSGVQVVSDDTQAAYFAAQSVENLSKEGRSKMQHTAQDMEATAKTIQSAGQLMESLRERSQTIGGIITVIHEIAEQTNLLALNAAIEAARAGEQGRGFAVVADEVRKLAERTSAATVEITSLIDAVRNDTLEAAQCMDIAQGQMSQGIEAIHTTSESLNAISACSQDAATQSRHIANAMQEQSHASSDVAVNINRIASLAEDNSSIVREVAAVSEAMQNTADLLSKLVDRFSHTSSR